MGGTYRVVAPADTLIHHGLPPSPRRGTCQQPQGPSQWLCALHSAVGVVISPPHMPGGNMAPPFVHGTPVPAPPMDVTLPGEGPQLGEA